jgi:hypothetical protein
MSDYGTRSWDAWARGLLKTALGWPNFHGLKIFFSNISTNPKLQKKQKLNLLSSKFFQTLPDGRSIQTEQLSFSGGLQIPNGF